MKSFALSLVFIIRFKPTRKWPIREHMILFFLLVIPKQGLLVVRSKAVPIHINYIQYNTTDNTIQYNNGEISHSPRGFSGLIYNTVWGTLAILLVTQFTINQGSERCPRPEQGQTTTPATTSPTLFEQ